MPQSSKLKSVLPLSLSLILIGCANDKLILQESGRQIGVANARVSLPELPTSCTKEYPPVIPRVGQEALVGLKKANGIIKASNRDNVNCADWYQDLSEGLAGDGVPATEAPQP